MTDFPRQIWQGQSSSRPDLHATKAPDHTDWMAMIAELQAVQGYILNLADSMDTMPNLAQKMKGAVELIDTISDNLAQLTPPQDLQKNVDELREEVKDAISVKSEHDRLKRGVKKLFLRTEALIRAHKKLKTETEHAIKILTNSVRVNAAKLRKDMENRYENLAEQVSELQDVLENPELD